MRQFTLFFSAFLLIASAASAGPVETRGRERERDRKDLPTDTSKESLEKRKVIEERARQEQNRSGRGPVDMRDAVSGGGSSATSVQPTDTNPQGRTTGGARTLKRTNPNSKAEAPKATDDHAGVATATNPADGRPVDGALTPEIIEKRLTDAKVKDVKAIMKKISELGEGNAKKGALIFEDMKSRHTISLDTKEGVLDAPQFLGELLNRVAKEKGKITREDLKVAKKLTCLAGGCGDQSTAMGCRCLVALEKSLLSKYGPKLTAATITAAVGALSAMKLSAGQSQAVIKFNNDKGEQDSLTLAVGEKVAEESPGELATPDEDAPAVAKKP